MISSRNKSRIEKLESHFKELQLSVEKKDGTFYDVFKLIIGIVDEYIYFDPILPEIISTILTKSFQLVFKAIRYNTQGRYFDEAYQDYEKYKEYLIDEEICAEISADLSFIFWMTNDMNKALEQGKRSVELLEKCGNSTILTGRYSNIGYIYEYSGNLDEALRYYQLGLQYGLYIQNEEVLSLAYTGLGRISAMRGKMKLAIHYFLEAKKRIPDHDSDNYLTVSNNLGIAYGTVGMYQEALDNLEPFINENTRITAPDTYITFSINSANNYKILNKLDKAEALLYGALDCAEGLNFYNDIPAIMVNLGSLKIRQKDYESAWIWFKKAKDMNLESKNDRQLLVILHGIATADIELERFSEAIDMLKAAEKLASKMDLRKELAINHELFSSVYESLGNIEESYEHYKKYANLSMSIKNEEYKKEIEAFKHTQEQPLDSPEEFKFYQGSSLISQELQKLVKMPLIGCNATMQNVVRQALMVAENENLPVLIIGETGSGKEAIARVIHYAGTRKCNPFVSVNSAAFATSLVESAFFGSEKGSYTGSARKSIGYFEAANKGTLFLDEIGEMPLRMQSKFLRVIEEKVINRIGSTKDTKVDFRLISATNKDLSSMAISNTFRFDLLNRINVMEIHIPPLRQRQEDIPLLVEYYVQTLCSAQGRATPVITKEAIDLLVNYQYPGNIRELKNILQRSLLLCRESVLDTESISIPQQTSSISDNHPILPSLNLAECEEWIINRAMEQSNHIQKNAAQLLGITPYSLSRKLKRIREEKSSKDNVNQ